MQRGITAPTAISTVGGEYERNSSGVWTNSVGTVAGSTPAKKVHLDELRTALTQAYQAAGQSAPSYTDSAIVAQQTMIKASHVSELRSAVRALE